MEIGESQLGLYFVGIDVIGEHLRGKCYFTSQVFKIVIFLDQNPTEVIKFVENLGEKLNNKKKLLKNIHSVY